MCSRFVILPSMTVASACVHQAPNRTFRFDLASRLRSPRRSARQGNHSPRHQAGHIFATTRNQAKVLISSRQAEVRSRAGWTTLDRQRRDTTLRKIEQTASLPESHNPEDIELQRKVSLRSLVSVRGTGQTSDRFFKDFSAMLVVAELIKTGTGRSK
jgi:hypothetical protein